MKRKVLTVLTVILSFSPAILLAQEEESMSLGQRINDFFIPISEGWEELVLTSIPIAGFDIPIVLILLIGGATWFTIYFSFVNIRRFPLAINVVRGEYDFVEEETDEYELDEDMFTRDGDIIETIKDESEHGEVSHFQALTAAVSGTVGLGNIAGVAVAIAMGGPGATFWMVICGLLGMSTKFVECTLGVKYRDIDASGTVHGGPMYYLKRGLKELKMSGFGKILAVVFSILCVGASLGGGNAFQANQAVSQVTTMIGIQGNFINILLGVIIAFLVAVVIIGGIKRIGNVTEKVIPFMAGLYILASLIIIGFHFNQIDDAFTLIFNEAFNPSAGLGGIVGVLIVGFRRAAFSNEAGVGSAPIAHSAVKTKYPASEGVVALLEPFIDTVVICTMTALVIIFFNMDGHFEYGAVEGANVFMQDIGKEIGGVDLTSLAFDSTIPGFSYVLTIAIVLFAFSTMLSWSYYGLQSWKYLFGRSKAADLSYKILFLAFIIIGAATTLDAVINFSDAMILAMVFPNMIGLLFLAPKVRKEMKRYLKAISQKFDIPDL